MEKTLTPEDLRAIIVSVELLRSNQNNLEQFNSDEFIQLAASSGLKVEHHIFSKQKIVSANHFLSKGKTNELKNLVESENIKLQSGNFVSLLDALGIFSISEMIS